MALTICPDCKKGISDAAPTCPHCGRPNTATPVTVVQQGDGCAGTAIKGFLILCLLLTLGVGACFVFVAGIGGAKRAGIIATPTPVPLTADEQRLGRAPGYCPGRYLKVVGALRGEDAPPCVVEMYLSKALKDPASFKMDSLCKVVARETAWVATCTYRARNSFGGYNLSTTDFSIKNGQLVDVKERSN